MVDGNTDLSSITNATINIVVVDVHSSQGFYLRVLLQRIMSTDIDHAMTTESGTNFGPTTNDRVRIHAV